jgi:hypothetical protein
MSITELLIQYGYLTNEQYNYAYQLQQKETVEMRKPLLQIYLEQNFLGLEHIEYCLSVRKQYIEQGYVGTHSQVPQHEIYHENVQEQQFAPTMVKCKVCLSDCQSNWSSCPFCGNSLR